MNNREGGRRDHTANASSVATLTGSSSFVVSALLSRSASFLTLSLLSKESCEETWPRLCINIVTSSCQDIFDECEWTRSSSVLDGH